MIKTIAIIYDKKLKPETEEPAEDTIEYFKNKGCKVIVNPKMFKVDIDIAIVYGGDGLLLHTANRIGSCKIPIIGVNYGRVGYLCKVQKSDNGPTFWNMLLNEKYGVLYKTRIMAEITNSGITEYVDALNEISIGGIDKTIYLKTIIKQEFNKKANDIKVLESIGDGIIISTKTGSTAYNVNAGGSVLLSDVFSVVSNNCLFQSSEFPINTKSIVTNTDFQFEIKIMNNKKENLPWLIADGQRRHKITENDEIIIKKSPIETLFIEI